jgi:hypothetical protein
LVLNELTRAVIARPIEADFPDLVRQWTPDPAFDEILAAQRQIAEMRIALDTNRLTDLFRGDGMRGCSCS